MHYPSPAFSNAKISYSESMEVEDAIHTAIMALKEGFEGQINEYSLEVGVARSCTQPGPHGDIKHIGEFRKLTTSEIKDCVYIQ